MILEPGQIKKEIEDIIGQDLSINSRKIPFIHYKQMYMKLAAMFTVRNLTEIGNIIGRSYAAVIHGRDVFENQLMYDEKLRGHYDFFVAKYSLTEKIVVKNVNLIEGIIFI